MKKIYILSSILASGLIVACSGSKKVADKPQKTTEQVVNDGLSSLNEDGVDRSIRPPAGEAKEITVGNYESFKLENGLKVFVIENHKLPTISYSLSIDRKPIEEGSKAGYVSIAGSLLEAGTTTRPKEKLDQEIDFMGASLSAGATGVYASGLSKYKGEILNILADVTLNPSFPQEEFDKLIKQNLSGLEAAEEDADAILSNVANAMLYGKKHAYGEFETKETINNIKIEDCKNYYKKYFQPDNSILTIVGDISLEDAKTLAENSLSKWKKGTALSETFTQPVERKNTEVFVVNKDGAVQSNISISNLAKVSLGDEDYEAIKVLNEIYGSGFSGRLFQNLREDKSYTYGAYGGINPDKYIGEFSSSAKVRNEVTDSAVEQFLYEINRMRTELVSEDELRNAKNYIAGTFAQALESPRTLASFASRIDRYSLPKDYFKGYLKRIENVTAEDIKRVANKYMQPNNLTITIVGDAAAVGPKLARFGTVSYLNKQAEVVEAPKVETVNSDITAADVINKYIAAIGGAKKLKEVKNVSIEMTSTMQGMEVSMMQIKAAPNKSKMTMTLPAMGMDLMEQVFDGEKAKIVAQGMEQPVSEEDQKKMADEMMFPELYYAEKGFKTELKGIKSINGVSAYEVEVTSPSGDKTTEFYAKESGFKIRESQVVEGPTGEMTSSTDLGDYKAVDGIQFPHTMKIPLGGGMDMKAEVKTIKVNTTLPADTFKVN